MSAKILVTGAGGMVGRALISRLINEGVEVIACVYPGKTGCFESLINSSLITQLNFRRTNVELINIIELDITNCCWDYVLDNVTHVVHLAAMVHVHRKKDQKWDEFYKTNVLGTKTLCEAIVKKNIEKFIFMSTVGVHGDYPRLSTDGRLLIEPSNYYSRSKLMAEQVVQEILDDKIPYVILRPVMIFGPGDKGNMARMINAIKSRKFFIPGSGNNKKSAIYVDDVVEIIYRLLNRKDISKEIFIVSNHKVISLREMCDEISRRLKGWVPSVPISILKVIAAVCDLIPVVPFNSKVLDKLTMDSDFSSYSILQEILGIDKETTFTEALTKMGM